MEQLGTEDGFETTLLTPTLFSPKMGNNVHILPTPPKSQ